MWYNNDFQCFITAFILSVWADRRKEQPNLLMTHNHFYSSTIQFLYHFSPPGRTMTNITLITALISTFSKLKYLFSWILIFFLSFSLIYVDPGGLGCFLCFLSQCLSQPVLFKLWVLRSVTTSVCSAPTSPAFHYIFSGSNLPTVAMPAKLPQWAGPILMSDSMIGSKMENLTCRPLPSPLYSRSKEWISLTRGCTYVALE